MRYPCKKCGKWVKDKFLFGVLHTCFPFLTKYRIENKIFQLQELNEKTGEMKHIYYYVEG